MTLPELLWVGCGVTAFMLLPVGAIRMAAYRSGEIDHTPTLRRVALLALVLGGAALVGFVALSAYLVLRGDGPW
jgi:hypothetical protein